MVQLGAQPDQVMAATFVAMAALVAVAVGLLAQEWWCQWLRSRDDTDSDSGHVL